MNVLLSVEPQYGEAILSGIKKYEFRRTIFKRKDIGTIYIYLNSSVRKIVGSFDIKNILEGAPKKIWKMCHEHGGITRDDFFSYFDGAKKAYGIEVKNVKRFSRPIDPFAVLDNFKPPQSFYYVPESVLEKLIERK